MSLQDLPEPERFKRERERLNDLVFSYLNLPGKRFFALDNEVYQSGALETSVKELLGLVASLVLRCDDCVRYHLMRCHQLGLSKEAVVECLEVGLVVGGSIVIPHLRRAIQFWDELMPDPPARE
ncbi:MAG: carboxymuconolactone decarboxylase family protein [bacterium]